MAFLHISCCVTGLSVATSAPDSCPRAARRTLPLETTSIPLDYSLHTTDRLIFDPAADFRKVASQTHSSCQPTHHPTAPPPRLRSQPFCFDYYVIATSHRFFLQMIPSLAHTIHISRWVCNHEREDVQANGFRIFLLPGPKHVTDGSVSALPIGLWQGPGVLSRLPEAFAWNGVWDACRGTLTIDERDVQNGDVFGLLRMGGGMELYFSGSVVSTWRWPSERDRRPVRGGTTDTSGSPIDIPAIRTPIVMRLYRRLRHFTPVILRFFPGAPDAVGRVASDVRRTSVQHRLMRLAAEHRSRFNNTAAWQYFHRYVAPPNPMMFGSPSQ
ncbi:hypothetical protein PAPYR_12479 [Paratrimastix pyriformis]|uniref:Uncharacterized protein n=1 Tax=Paratrimastix pyriformis TaxID=342808 RepID=A0ABQ8U725_9EUKA|nr:hypothetical protein PAPYR_12479 [Paratrimastix pyriformis]